MIGNCFGGLGFLVLVLRFLFIFVTVCGSSSSTIISTLLTGWSSYHSFASWMIVCGMLLDVNV